MNINGNLLKAERQLLIRKQVDGQGSMTVTELSAILKKCKPAV
jgi:DeoR/GlpR family transcriptional regulator of sugar metabolism